MASKTNINTKVVEHIAKLANLTLSQKEILDYQKKLLLILEYFDSIKDVDATEIEATKTTTPVINVFRDDKVQPSLTQKAALSNANKAYKGYFQSDAVFHNDNDA